MVEDEAEKPLSGTPPSSVCKLKKNVFVKDI